MLIPLLTVANTQSTGLVPTIDIGRIKNLEGRLDQGDSSISSRDVEALGFSFIIALGAYVLLRTRSRGRRYMSIGPYSY